MCNVNLKDELRSDKLRERLNLDSIERCVQNGDSVVKIRWTGGQVEWPQLSRILGEKEGHQQFWLKGLW